MGSQDIDYDSLPLSDLTALAEGGDPKAQFETGTVYYSNSNGRHHGVSQDLSLSFQWRLRSARQGHHEAQYCVGDMYRYGLGVEQDPKAAVEWFERAFLSGTPHAPSGQLPLAQEAARSLRTMFADADRYPGISRDWIASPEVRALIP